MNAKESGGNDHSYTARRTVRPLANCKHNSLFYFILFYSEPLFESVPPNRCSVGPLVSRIQYIHHFTVHKMLMVSALRVYSCFPLIILIPFNSERAHLTFGAIYYESPLSAASSSFNFFSSLFIIVSFQSIDLIE